MITLRPHTDLKGDGATAVLRSTSACPAFHKDGRSEKGMFSRLTATRTYNEARASTALASLILDGLVSTFLVFLDLVFHFNLKLTHHVDTIFIQQKQGAGISLRDRLLHVGDAGQDCGMCRP